MDTVYKTCIGLEEIDSRIGGAIRAHQAWRTRLQDAISRGEPLAPDEIADDRLCELGHWIDKLQPILGKTWEWQHLNEVHAAFHREAGECARLILDGKGGEAIQHIREGGYALQSSRILDALMRLRDVLLQAPSAEKLGTEI